MARAVPRLATTLIGSYPQPDWLIGRERLRSSLPARVRAEELWRVGAPYLQQAQDDATALAIREFERAGVDILTDGEIRRESYSNRFATALEGMDVDNPAMVPGRAGGVNAVPRVVGPIRRTHPVEVGDARFCVQRPSADQGHAAGAIHDEPAGAQRGLPGCGEPRHGSRRRRQRGAA
jgi:5-methyltetrahydropteroyltriglutamate--homocysteine methyltransferase